jgi:hypothetical protein
MNLGSPDFLVSARRRRIIEQRDCYHSEQQGWPKDESKR